MGETEPYVVFGYGSLIFKPPPHTVSQVPGFLKGYVRRFAQKSHDHRGTLEDPGRVATLIHKEDWDTFSGSDAFPDEDIVWGIAYTIDPIYAADVQDYLDHREKDGYTLETLDIYGFRNGKEIIVVSGAYCYVGRPDNPSFLGSEPLDILADRIWRSVGPSGPNKEYFYKLADSVRKLAPEAHDSHLSALEKRIRALDQKHGMDQERLQAVMNTKNPYVVFGYGSLVFKPPPHVIYQVPGFLKGYVRRFSQMSHYHRGTPENPGRAVTLIHKEDWDQFSGSDPFPDDDIVWGIAYTIDPSHEAEVKDYMDFREKDGYTLETLDIYGVRNGKETVLIHGAFCYVGHNDNPSFVGSEPLDDLARLIWKSVGPSGPNKEYVYKLAGAVRELAPEAHDSHLYALETKIRELDNTRRK